MTRARWDEAGLSEDPAVATLVALGWIYVAPETLITERDSMIEVVVPGRLAKALRRLNPGLSEDNVQRAVRTLTSIAAVSLLEANEKAHTMLVHGIALEEDQGGNRRSRTVRFIDFDDPKRNEFVVTQQFEVKGSKTAIRPDVVLFVNGIPLVVVECKSPTLGDKWLHEAVEQLHRYQELGEKYRDLGAPALFHTCQVLVATCGQAASVGTIATPQRFFGEWKTTYPESDEALATKLDRTPTPQDVLFRGVLASDNLLDLTRSFVAFERDASTGKVVRKIPRYQQYRAVNRGVERARTRTKPEDRGGVVWHTQGSGKSLTMLWLSVKLRLDPTHENPTIVIVTDRRDLDDQITKTFQSCGFPNPQRAESVREMRKLLSGPTGKTVMTTVQKFQELASAGSVNAKHPVLTTAKNVFVLTDEAHRTQYGSLAANLRHALPNAAFFAFTGTPIDKTDRSTLGTFGDYIDRYTIEQAVADGAVVPIFYEGRLPELRIVGASLDKLFDRVFADRTEEEREAIKKKYATEEAIASAPKRIEAVCLDLLEHFTKFIQPNGFKAQVVAVSRDAAVLYKETLDRLNAPQSAVVISGSNDDEAHLRPHITSPDQRRDLVERFLKKADPLSILVVCDMLLTGFDAPVEQVMYLDKPLKEHSLLQAIARVNRTNDGKTYGLVIDYWGVSEALQEALAIFSPSDVKGAMEPKGDELPRLEARHAVVVRFFVRVKDRKDLDACLRVIEPEDVRAEFDEAFRRFSASLDMLLPDTRALPYVEDARWLGKIRQAARARFRDETLDVSDCGAKVRKLIEDAIVADGIQILVKEVSIFSKAFDEKVDALKTPEAKASEMEHGLRKAIHVNLGDDPVFYASLRQRLEQIIEDRKQKRIDAAKQLELLDALVKEMRGRAKAAEDVGMTPVAYAIYGIITTTGIAEPVPRYQRIDESKKELATLLEETVEPETTIIDWIHKDDVHREMRKKLKRLLRASGYEPDRVETLAGQLVDLLKVRKGVR
ncbi:MAG: type I restriction endonuclease subunit R [Deltaproteobacteria bacterium]|nr:type I restriction endonuclease subunit R [Deltaproteobacteria bacterium]